MNKLPLCPRCGGEPKAKNVYGISVLQCQTLDCGAVVTNHGGVDVELKWAARVENVTDTQCPHCGSEVEPFEFCFSGINSYGFACKGCGCATGGRSKEQALEIHKRGLNGIQSEHVHGLQAD